MSAGDASPPTNLKEAAARLIMGELWPLLERAEEITAEFKVAHTVLGDDLVRIGATVTKMETTFADAAKHLAYLIEQARAIEKNQENEKASPAPVPGSGFGGGKIVALVVLCSVLSAALAVGAVAMFNSSTVEHARLGRAVEKALRYIDDPTRQKLQAAIQKAGS